MIWSPDAVNATFLFGGGVLLWINVYRLLRDKKVAGVSFWPALWFASWGVWDCYYFPHLNQWWSFVSSALAVLPNAAWLFLYWKYRRN